MTLTEFLLPRIAEDQARAERMDEHYAPFEREWEWCPRARAEPLGDLPGGPDAECDCNCPAAKRRALAECEAKRRIATHAQVWETTLHRTPEGWTEQTATAYRMAMEWTVRHLGEVYTEHPDYDEGWRP